MYMNGKSVKIPAIDLKNIDTTRSLKNDSVRFPFLLEQASAEEQEFVKDMTEDIKIPRHKQVESVAVYMTIHPDKLKRVHTVLMVEITTTDGKQYSHCIGFTAEKSQEQAVTILEKFFQAGAPGMNARIAARQSAFFEKCTTPSENEKADRVIAYLKSGMSVDEVITRYRFARRISTSYDGCRISVSYADIAPFDTPTNLATCSCLSCLSNRSCFNRTDKSTIMCIHLRCTF